MERTVELVSTVSTEDRHAIKLRFDLSDSFEVEVRDADSGELYHSFRLTHVELLRIAGEAEWAQRVKQQAEAA